MSATREEGDEFLKNGEYEAAVAAYDRVIKMEPDDAFSLYNRATAKEKLELYDEAYEDYDKLVKLQQNSRLAMLGRSRCLFAQEKYDYVILDMNTLLRADPDNFEALDWRGRSTPK